MIHETFWTLLQDPAHWLFEIFVTLVFDGVVLGMLWPFLRKHWKHHVERDSMEHTEGSPSEEWPWDDASHTWR